MTMSMNIARKGLQTSTPRPSLPCFWLALTLLAAPAYAQSDASLVAAVQGPVDVQQGGTWKEATIGLTVAPGDRVRTGANARAKLVLADDSVVDLAPATEGGLESQLFDPAARRFQTVFRLAKGKVHVQVSDYYHEARARYEVETPTAVAIVRGTEFVVGYNSATELTEVVGIVDQVEVFGKLAVLSGGVRVGPQSYTQVQKGRFPTPPKRLDPQRFAQLVGDIELLGTGRRDGLNVRHAAVDGQVLSPEDRPAAVPPVPMAAPVAEGVPVGQPEPSLADAMFPDFYTNSQPLLQYQQTPPGPPTGGVQVGF